MYAAAVAMNEFFSGFGLEAYPENTVPEDAELPYITYSLNVPEWNQKATNYARVWYRSRANSAMLRKADQITAALGEGKKLPLDAGYLVLWPESPKGQVMVDGDTRSVYLNFSINAYHMPGV